MKSKSTINIGFEIVKTLGQQEVFIFILVPVLYFLLRMRRVFIIGSQNIRWFRDYKFMRNCSSPLNFFPICYWFKMTWWCPSAHSARSRKIPGWIVIVRENFTVNKGVCRTLTIEIVLRGLCLFSFFRFYIWLSRLSSQKVENNSIDFCTRAWKKI